MKSMLITLVLTFSLFSPAQNSTQNTPAPIPKAEAINPAAPEKPACQQGKGCCQHETATKNGHESMACCAGKNAVTNSCCSGKDMQAKGCCAGKDAKSCCGAKNAKACCDKGAMACMRAAMKDKSRQKTGDCCSSGARCCEKADAGEQTAMACCHGTHADIPDVQPATR